jgi:DNA topoisomerase-1
MKLLIVESPAKAKTIKQYAGKGFVVKSSVGHIRDLPKSNKQAIDIAHGFAPHYVTIKGKEAVVADLKKSVGEADEVLLATDPDREGEAIAWHIVQATGLADKKRGKPPVHRIVFHEITKTAIQEALEHPRDIDENLRRAQEARRVLDRLVGYDLSGLIWKKVRYGLSAGRVQSPALRIIMERERLIRAFTPEKYWVITAELETKKGILLSFTCAEEPRELEEAERIVTKGKSGVWSVTEIDEREAKRSPRPPFITSTLQQAASSRLGFSPSRTMRLAQNLYEAGHITYMRTDSTVLSSLALHDIEAVIKASYGDDYFAPRTFKVKSKNAQEAHEAIRPTHVSAESAGKSEEERKLYRLIRARALASQMSEAKILRTKISANIASGGIPDFAITGSRTLFDGWLKADSAAKGEDVEVPRLAKGDPLRLQTIGSEGKETTPPSRYTEAGLVKELEARGIGRPSTYASILKTIEARGYVEKEGKTLRPTDVGDVVSSFLEANFSSYISDSFTAEMEDELDDIAQGKRGYEKTLKDFYGPFAKEVKSKNNTEKITTLGDAPDDIRCPVCGGRMVIKLGRGGKFLSCARFPDCAGARTIDGKELAPPKETGEDCPDCKKGRLVEREGRFGRFIACSNYPKCKFIKKDEAAEKEKMTDVQCPVCKEGFLMERRGRFGAFYSCSNYPKCAYAIKAKPTGKICEKCGSLMMEGTKTIPERCSNKACENHRPPKKEK